MVSLDRAKDYPKRQFWDELQRVHAGMLGVAGSTLGMQPMSPQVEPETETIWFFTKTSSALVEEINANSVGMFCLTGKDHDYHACITGPVEVRRDEKVIDRFWGSMVEAWYEEGREDPGLTLIEMRVKSAEIWASTGNPIKLGWEMAKANMNDNQTPDVGIQRHVDFG